MQKRRDIRYLDKEIAGCHFTLRPLDPSLADAAVFSIANIQGRIGRLFGTFYSREQMFTSICSEIEKFEIVTRQSTEQPIKIIKNVFKGVTSREELEVKIDLLGK